MEGLINALRQCETREEAKQILSSYKRKDLLAIGRDLSFDYMRLKKDKKELIEQIVNSTIGSRLRIEAIAQIDLSRRF